MQRLFEREGGVRVKRQRKREKKKTSVEARANKEKTACVVHHRACVTRVNISTLHLYSQLGEELAYCYAKQPSCWISRAYYHWPVLEGHSPGLDESQ